MSARRLRSLVGPAGAAYFISTWLVAGFMRNGYDPFEDAISRLAEQGAPNRWLVTSGMIAFGLGALVFAPLLKRPASITLAIAGIASLGVATFPCSAGCPRDGTSIDVLHSLAAAAFYVSFTVTPILQTRSRYAIATSIVAAISLSLHGLSIANGFTQRIGVTSLDLWLIYTGLRAAASIRSREIERAG